MVMSYCYDAYLSYKTWNNQAGIHQKFHLYWVDFIVLKGAMYANGGEIKLSIPNSCELCHENFSDWPDKICPLVY